MAGTSIPTPWHVDADNRDGMSYNNHVVAANGNAVCFMAWSGDAEDNKPHEDAAHLIAAAPELLATMKRMAEGWQNAIELDLIPPQHVQSAMILCAEAEAAISRATNTTNKDG